MRSLLCSGEQINSLLNCVLLTAFEYSTYSLYTTGYLLNTKLEFLTFLTSVPKSTLLPYLIPYLEISPLYADDSHSAVSELFFKFTTL